MPFKKKEDYAPKQRAVFAMVENLKGNKYLRDCEVTYEECRDCGEFLRVRRRKRGPIVLYCVVCGFEAEATEITEIPRYQEEEFEEEGCYPDLLFTPEDENDG